MKISEAQRLRNARYHAKNRDRIKARKHAYYAARPEQRALEQAAYYAANKERIGSYRSVNKEKLSRYFSDYRKRNRIAIRAKVARYRAACLLATPKWANHFFIEEIYDLAMRRTAMTGFDWHVDHIVPLQSKSVCGLHVEHNLQVIPAALNFSKGNHRWPDMSERMTS